MRLSVVLPTLNEVEGLPRTLARLPRADLERDGFLVDVVVVDGASTDGTPEKARGLGARVLNEPRRGYGRAYKTGLRDATGDIVVTADADDTYPLDQLPALLNEFRSRALDFATVNRYQGMERGSMSRTNRFGNWALTVVARLLYSITLRDSQSGMWILGPRALARLDLERFADGMAFSQQVKLHAFRDHALRCAELPGRYYVRAGEVKLSRWRDGLGNLWQLVRGRFSMVRPRST